jgi:ribonuclease E
MTDSHDERPSAPADAPQAPAAKPQADASSPAANAEHSGPEHASQEHPGQDHPGEGGQESKPAKRSRGRRGGRGRKRKDKPADSPEVLSDAQPADHAEGPSKGRSENKSSPAPAKRPAQSSGSGQTPSAAQAIDAAYGLGPAGQADGVAPDAAPGSVSGQGGQEAQEPAAKSRSRSRGRRSSKSKQVACGAPLEAQGEAKGSAKAVREVSAADEPEEIPAKGAESKKKRKKMFIGVLPGELVEVVLTEDGAVQEYYVEMLHQVKAKGNIYKGYIHNIDSALQAAFVNYGAERNGFLQIDEVHPEYYQGSYPLKKGARYPLMQKVLKAGQEVLVQVVKEPTGKKGAFVTSYLSLPGRYFVYTLGRDQQGVSRKIEDEKERERLKGVIDQISPPDGVGLIVRTAGIGRVKTELMRDYKYLHRLWTDIKKKVQTEKAPALVYKEMELSVRAARDYLTQEVSEVWVDDPDTAAQIREYVALAFPKSPDMVKVHTEHDRTLWERFGLTRQVEQIYSREVTLPSGGRLVFDHTEALTSVDINSGKIGGEQSFAKMALKTNTEAALEIARQLRLRDIGGQIVIDFIEMKDGKHLREVEKVMRQALKSDRARTDVSGISPFGLMELVRQRLGSSAISVSTEPCPCCGGTGIRRNLEWQAMQTMKTIHRLLRRPGCPNPLQVPVGQELALYMLNNKRELLTEMGARVDTRVEIVVDTRQP